MSTELKMALLTTFLTVISGVVVYVISEYIKEFYIEPRKKYKDLVQKIDYSLIMYAREILRPLDTSKQNDEYHLKIDACKAVSKALRDLSAELASKSSRLRFSRKTEKAKRKKAAEELMGLSNCIFENGKDDLTRNHNEKSVSTIRQCLNIDMERGKNGTKNISKKRNKRS